jgi:hypothetical protein
MKIQSAMSLRKWILLALKSRPARLIPDKPYLQLKYWCLLGERLNLDTPMSYSEKLQWLKLYDRKPEYTRYVDKVAVRDFVAKTIEEEYLVPVFGVYDNYDEINFDALPDQFVLKPNHASGNIFACADKAGVDHKKLKREVNRWLKRKFYYRHREWPYKDIKPKILCEKYLMTQENTSVSDFGIFCFDAEPKALFVVRGRNVEGNSENRSNGCLGEYDTDWNYMPYKIKGQKTPEAGPGYPRPAGLDKMLELSRMLSKGLIHVRVDFHYDELTRRIYFEELTFFHESGFRPWEPKEYELMFGSWIKLPTDPVVEDR